MSESSSPDSGYSTSESSSSDLKEVGGGGGEGCLLGVRLVKWRYLSAREVLGVGGEHCVDAVGWSFNSGRLVRSSSSSDWSSSSSSSMAEEVGDVVWLRDIRMVVFPWGSSSRDWTVRGVVAFLDLVEDGGWYLASKDMSLSLGVELSEEEEPQERSSSRSKSDMLLCCVVLCVEGL